MNFEFKDKIIQFPSQVRLFNLFADGNLVNVGLLSNIDNVFRRGLLSAMELRRDRGDFGSESGTDDDYVPFWRFNKESKGENCLDLIHHIERESDDFDEYWPVGYLVRNQRVVKLDYGEHYYGVERHVPPIDIDAVVIPMIPLRIFDGRHLDNSENKSTLKKVRQSMAIYRGSLNKRIVVCDHFGRVI